MKIVVILKKDIYTYVYIHTFIYLFIKKAELHRERKKQKSFIPWLTS